MVRLNPPLLRSELIIFILNVFNMDSKDINVVVDKNVIVPHYHHLTSKNGWLKYDQRVMHKKYTTSLRSLWDVR